MSTEYLSKTKLETSIRTIKKQLREAKMYDRWEYICHAGREHKGYEWIEVNHDIIGFPTQALKMKSVWATQFVIERLEVNPKKPIFDIYIYHVFDPQINEFTNYKNTCEITVKISSEFIQKDLIIKDINKWKETLDLKMFHKG